MLASSNGPIALNHRANRCLQARRLMLLPPLVSGHARRSPYVRFQGAKLKPDCTVMKEGSVMVGSLSNQLWMRLPLRTLQTSIGGRAPCYCLSQNFGKLKAEFSSSLSRIADSALRGQSSRRCKKAKSKGLRPKEKMTVRRPLNSPCSCATRIDHG